MNGRISKQIIPFLLGGAVYENRLPIGLPEVIKNLTREEVSAFYKKWYRPELMSVIVVGDTDVSVLEKSVKDAMSVIPPSNEKISTMFNRVPYSEEKDILIIKDSEQVYPIINIFDHTEIDNIYITEADFKNGMCKYFASSIFNQRASEITNTVDAPWLAVGVGENAYSNHDLFPYLGVVPKEGMFETSLKKLFDEYERFIAFGITESELERVKKEVAANNAKYRANKNHEKGSDVADRIIRQIILGSVNQSVEDYCEVYMRLLSQITAEDVNTYARSVFKNRGNRFFLIAPENYPCPSENEIMELWNNYHND